MLRVRAVAVGTGAVAGALIFSPLGFEGAFIGACILAFVGFLLVHSRGQMDAADKRQPPASPAPMKPPPMLPQGFIARPGEKVLVGTMASIALPTVHTSGMGVAGGFFAFDATQKVVTGDHRKGVVVMTNQRLIVSVGSDVRDWPIEQIISYGFEQATWRRSSTAFVVRVGNVGAVSLKFIDRKGPRGAEAMDALRLAQAGEA